MDYLIWPPVPKKSVRSSNCTRPLDGEQPSRWICPRRTPVSTVKTKAIRLLLVDDHEVVRVGLTTVLSQQKGLVVVGEAATMATAVHDALRLKPDVILMDVRLPDGSGVDACRDILASSPGT